MKKKSLQAFLVASICILFIAITTIYFLNDKSQYKVEDLNFINTKLLISGKVGEELTFPTIFFINKQIDSKKLIDDVFLLDSPNAEIVKWDVTDGSTYKDSKLNNISITIKLTKVGNNVINGLKIRFKSGKYKEYKFKGWITDVLDGSQNNLMVASKEAYIASNSYTIFDLKNISGKTLKLAELDLISDKATIDGNFTVNGRTYTSIKDIELSKNDIIDLSISPKFQEYYDILYIRPYIKYTLDGKEIREPITQGSVYGLQIDENKMSKMYNKYINRK